MTGPNDWSHIKTPDGIRHAFKTLRLVDAPFAAFIREDEARFRRRFACEWVNDSQDYNAMSPKRRPATYHAFLTARIEARHKSVDEKVKRGRFRKWHVLDLFKTLTDAQDGLAVEVARRKGTINRVLIIKADQNEGMEVYSNGL